MTREKLQWRSQWKEAEDEEVYWKYKTRKLKKKKKDRDTYLSSFLVLRSKVAHSWRRKSAATHGQYNLITSWNPPANSATSSFTSVSSLSCETSLTYSSYNRKYAIRDRLIYENLVLSTEFSKWGHQSSLQAFSHKYAGAIPKMANAVKNKYFDVITLKCWWK